ncbi:hypothetical protein [Nonomuraea sp. KM90]|uniref:hypothetical protein n=1 Tax=Nonomuraea sp. KM90 TaxID=3457428 RepID=UPI003FCDAF74
MRRTIACLSLALLLLSSCGWSRRVSPGEFETRAREVTARWQGSADDRAWRAGFVPLEPLNPRGWASADQVPAWALLSAHNGVWQQATELPADAPAPADVRWPDGSVSQVPLVAAASAYAAFSAPEDFIEEECPAKGCRPLRVTGAELGEVPLETSRGRIGVPAWMFTVKGIEQRYVHVAVDPSAVAARPEPRQEDTEEVMGFEPVAGRPAELLLQYGHGACDTVHGARAYETGQVVVVDVDQEGSDGLCPAMLKIDTITVTLARPLGDRLVLDSGTGLPVVRGVNRR